MTFFLPPPSSVAVVFVLLHLVCLFCAVCSLFVSHGIRQRNSSVPLRELVDMSRATALIAPIQGPAGRQAIFGVEECPYCDPKKCLNGRPAGGSIGLCFTIRNADGLLVSTQCVGSRNELNRAMSVRQMPLTVPNRRQGCQRSMAEELGAEKTDEELCWCETAQHRKSLLEEGLVISDRASSIQHARRRKNHPGISTSYKRQSAEDNDGTTDGQKEQQRKQLLYQQQQHQTPNGAMKRKQSDRWRKNGTEGVNAMGHRLAIVIGILINCWYRIIWQWLVVDVVC